MERTQWKEILGWQEQEIDDLRHMGYAYITQGQYKIALKFFEALAVLSNEHIYDIQTLGALYLEMGDNLTALNYLEKAIKLDATHGPTLLNRAKALLALGYTKQGLMQAKSLEMHVESAIASQATALLLAYA